MIHDFWKPYYSNEAARHGLCNAHILRELVYAEEEKHHNHRSSLGLDPLHDTLYAALAEVIAV